MTHRIIVGPHAMRVTRHDMRSRVVSIGAEHGPAEVRAIGADLWAEIRPAVSWRSWLRHRLRMAWQRARTADARTVCTGPHHPGPRPDLIATKPWREARKGEWASLSPGVVARLLRGE